MKKLIVSVMMLCALIIPSAAVAEVRNAFEFCDLYSSRLMQLKDQYGINATHNQSIAMYSNIYSEIANQYAGENQYYANVPAGSILVSVPDFFIDQFDTIFIDLLDESEENIDIYRALMAMSALEHNGFDDHMFSIFHQVTSDPVENAIDAIFNILNEDLSPYLEDEEFWDNLMASKEETLIYSGNYDYYLRYEYLEGQPYEVVRLFAYAK